MTPREFTPEDQETWREILSRHEEKRNRQVCGIFLNGVSEMGLTRNNIPRLEDVNRVLMEKSGFRGVFVDGLEEAASFYEMLSRRCFPVGNFIRSRQDLGYTPAPDIVHDLYGHLPFFVDRAYGDFCQAFGAAASEHFGRPMLLRQFERFFWFTIEFGLVRTKDGLRVFGAGIASSTAECDYALSGVPRLLPFDVDVIRRQEFRIDEMQPCLFCLESPEQLYGSLMELSKKVREDA